MDLPPLSHFNARLAAAVRSKVRPEPVPDRPRVEHVAGESHEVLVRVAKPIGDWTLITVEHVADPQVVEQFPALGRVEEGTRGVIRWGAYRALAGWLFVPEPVAPTD